MVRSVISALLFWIVCLPVNGQDKAPKELLQYVHDAQKAGINPLKIQENAVNAGWPSTLVAEAIAQATSVEKAKPAEESGGKITTPPAGSAADPASSVVAPPAGAPQSATAAGRSDSPATVDAHQPGTVPDTPGAGSPADGSKLASKPSSSPPVAVPGTSGGGAKPAINPYAGIPEDYEIGAGDILKITVWHEPDASLQSVVVPPNGKISMPLLHDVEVAGMKIPDLEKNLTERLSSLMNAPEVSVAVTGMNSKKIYLTGKVRREGPLSYTYRMTVMQALSEAGGLTDFARRKGIYILRTENGRQFKLAFDYAAVLKGEHLETNIQLMPGDMIVVP